MTGARRKRKAIYLGELTKSVLRKADRGGRQGSAIAVSVWPEAVGPDITRHTKGFALREGGELVIFVDSAAWANQLSLMSTELLDRVNARIGNASVTSLRFTVSRSVKEEIVWRAAEEAAEQAYAPDPDLARPLDDVELKQAEKVASVVNDDALREMALRVMVKDLEQKKGARERRKK